MLQQQQQQHQPPPSAAEAARRSAIPPHQQQQQYSTQQQTSGRRQVRRSVRRYSFLPRLVLFNNLVFFLLWFCCLVRLLVLAPLVGRRFLPGGIAEYFQYLYTASLISQFVLSAFIFKFPRRLTLLKLSKAVAGLFVTWAVVYHFPKISRHTSYGFYLFAVSAQETLNYFYYFYPTNLLKYFKRRSFLVLYPVQKITEIALILVSFRFIQQKIDNDYYYLFSYLMKGILVSYIPVSISIYGFLWRIRTTRTLVV